MATREEIEAAADKAMKKNKKGKKKGPCWKGYEMVGTKAKSGKKVPNCVPKKK
tara:strand:+ start:370 stop:528 length:159 start_codon:yes stop_codon:yes gene_type:complete